MNLPNLLAISFLMLLLPVQPTLVERPCKEINATVEVKNTIGQNDGSFTVTIDGNPRQFRLHLIAPKKADNRLDVPVEEIKNLSAGEYELVITEAKEGEFCPKHIKVAIQ